MSLQSVAIAVSETIALKIKVVLNLSFKCFMAHVNWFVFLRLVTSHPSVTIIRLGVCWTVDA